MSELGRQLQEARTARHLSLADVESVTRIRQKYLEALENGEYRVLPRGATARGFLRTYAAYLGLDVAAALSLYVQESGEKGYDLPMAEPGKPRLVDYRPIEVSLIDDTPRMRWWPWILAFFIVVAASAGAWYFLTRNPGWNPLAAVLPPPTATATSTLTPTPWVVTATPRATQTLPPPPAGESQQAGPTPTSDLLPLPTPTVLASATPTRRPTATPEVVAQLTLELQVTQRAWVRVTVDGEVVEEGTLNANDARIWDALESITIRTGNAGGLTLILNGEDLGPMGQASQVLERTWVVAGGEVTEQAPGTTPEASPTSTG
jgi:cytoskeletal protein RodZ